MVSFAKVFNIDVSFKKDEQYALNQLIYPKMSELIMTDEMKVHSQSGITEFQALTSNRYSYYTNSGLPDALLRFFIYKATNLSDNKQHYIVDRSTTFKESFCYLFEKLVLIIPIKQMQCVLLTHTDMHKRSD